MIMKAYDASLVFIQKYLSIICIGLLFHMPANAQSAYHGGKGDGYASASIENVLLHIDPLSNLVQTVKLYPDPIKTSELLNIAVSHSKPYQIELTDLPGRILYFQNCRNENASVPILGLKEGTYIVRIHNDEINYIQKLVVIHP